MENSIIIRPIIENDKQGLVELYDRVWPETAGTKWGKTSWAVDTSEYKGMCAEKNGQIIGSRFAFHSNIYLGNQKLVCTQFGDSCVDVKYRGYGLFSRMNLEFLKSYFREGNELIYNVSVEASKKAYQKLGWQYIDAFSNLLFFPNCFRTLWKVKGNIKNIGGNPIYDKAAFPDTEKVSEDILELREKIFVEKRLIHTYYDKDTLRWRVKTDSGIKIFYDNCLGACLYKTGTKHGLRCLTIGEIFPLEYSQPLVTRILNQIISIEKFDLVNVSITISHPLYKYYRKYGFIHNPMKKYLNLGVRANSEIMRSVAYNPDNWGISTIDVDTF